MRSTSNARVPRKTVPAGPATAEDCRGAILLPADDSTALAPRLVALRNRLGRTLTDLENVNCTLRVVPSAQADCNSSDQDVFTVLCDAEALAERLGKEVYVLIEAVGSVNC